MSEQWDDRNLTPKMKLQTRNTLHEQYDSGVDKEQMVVALRKELEKVGQSSFIVTTALTYTQE